MKKKILSLVLILMLAGEMFMLTGCGSDEESVSSSDENSNESGIATTVKVGDYVAYEAGEEESYIATAERTGYNEDQTFKVKGDETWKVLSINDDGTIDLISTEALGTSTGEVFYLGYEAGYNNAQEELSNIVQIYKNDEYATSVRYMNDDDLRSLVNLTNVVSVLEEKLEVDLSDYKTSDELWEAINSIANENYENLYNTTDGSRIVTTTLGLNLEYGEDDIGGLQNLVTDQTAIELLDCDDNLSGIWLGTQNTSSWKLLENGMGNPYNNEYYYISYYSWETTSNTRIPYMGYYYSKEIYHTNEDLTTNEVEVITSYCKGAYIRPVVTLKSSVTIDYGSGTEEDPYVLK